MAYLILSCIATLLAAKANTVRIGAKVPAETFRFRFLSHFHDGVVLQRGGRGSTIAGFAPKGSAISTSFIPGSPPQTVIAGHDGRWTMLLPPVPASKSPSTLVFTRAAKPGAPPTATATLHDVLWGDVFLCGELE